MLPDIDGYDLIEYIKQFDIPVIFVTAKTSVPDRVKGLKLGAEDYISKPFMPQELLLRVYAVLRRTYKEDSPRVFLDGCTIDFSRAEVNKGGEIIPLTAKEHTLLETLALPEDTLYLALSPAVLETLAARYGAVRVSLSGALTAEELDAIGQSPSVQTFRAREASDLLTGLDADGLLPPSRRAAARAAVWDAFFRQNFELLPSTLPEALRSQSSSLLTDFAAQDYTLLGDILEFLVNRAAVFQSDALPGAWDRKAGTYTVTEASRAAVQTFLNVSPTEGQASSASEP